VVTHSARKGFLYTMERTNGQIVMVKPYLEKMNWTKGIDQKTGKPLDYAMLGPRLREKGLNCFAKWFRRPSLSRPHNPLTRER
jgi:glucose dehydrogenase